jgi:hypothetical protein
MAPWKFHELYPPIDVEKIPKYSHKLPLKWWEKKIPKFDGDALFATQHITSSLKFVSKLNIIHEDVFIKIFVYSLEGDPKSIGRA